MYDIYIYKYITMSEIKKTVRRSKKKIALDLFCGCGGMTKGLMDSGYEILAGIDIWDKAIENYNKNYDHEGICGDLKKLSPEEFNKKYNKKKKKNRFNSRWSSMSRF